ncbi:MAG: hypothetical protein ACYC8T_37075 [Myxococcaceae bacterium]
MADRVRIIEGTWNCTSCDTKGVLGRHKVCPTCGNPRETGKEAKFDFGGTTATGASTAASTTDQKALDAAKAGADWYCAYCGAGNRGDLPNCKNCRAERVKTTAAPAKPAAPPAAPAPAAPAKKRTGLWIVLAILGSGVLGVCGLGIWGMQTHERPGKVSAMSWERQVHRERFSPLDREGWRDQIPKAPPVMPVNGLRESPGATNIRGCVKKQRSTRKVADGEERVCHTKTRREQCGTEEKCSRHDLGNGFAEERCTDVPKYCSESYQDCRMETRYRTEPVFDQWCTYSTFAWKRVDTARAAGADASPRWPEAQAGELDRLSREEKYTVTFAYEFKGENKLHVVEPKSESEFVSWQPGKKAVLTVANAGYVTLVKPSP